MLAKHLDDLETLLALGLRADAAHAGLREATARLLLAVGPEQPLAMGSLAQRVGRDATTATRFVDRAVADGLLRRDVGAEDRRRRYAALTEAGGEARERLLAVRRKRTEALLEALLRETGLHEGQVEWFLESMLRGLRAAAGREG